MVKIIDSINVAADTFQTLVARVNTMIDTFASEVVTGNTDANGASLTGNSFVNGIFSSTTLTAGVLRGGNVQASAPLIISTNTAVNANFLRVGNTTTNTVINNTSIVIANSTVNITYRLPTAAQKSDESVVLTANAGWASLHTIDDRTTTTGTNAHLITSFDITVHHGAEYFVVVNDNTANSKQMSKILALATGNSTVGTIELTEYAIVQSNGVVGTFSANVNAGTARVYMTPTSANTTAIVKKSLSLI